MEKRSGALLVLFSMTFIALVSALVFARSGQCVLNPPSGQKEVCYNTFYINSVDGFGAAEVCGNCFLCGDQDGVCPEDFMNQTGPPGNCSSCNDPDCGAEINGIVNRADPPYLPIPGAEVKAIPVNSHLAINVTHTDVNGRFRLIVPNGPLLVSAAKVGLDTEINRTTVYSRQNITMDFLLPNASCDEQCTNYFGRCNKDCQGINGCAYKDWQNGYSLTAEMCNERRVGERVPLNDSGNYTTFVTCCDGNIVTTEKTPPATVKGDIETVITTGIPVIMSSGASATMMIAIW